MPWALSPKNQLSEGAFPVTNRYYSGIEYPRKAGTRFCEIALSVSSADSSPKGRDCRTLSLWERWQPAGLTERVIRYTAFLRSFTYSVIPSGAVVVNLVIPPTLSCT